EHAGAILQAFYPGARGGKALAKLLFGEISPSGKLPITLYRDLAHMPAFTDYAMTGRTYRFEEQAPLYPFGYALTYGDTALTAAAADAAPYEEAARTALVVTVTAENRGPMDVEAVLQVYVGVDGAGEVPNHPLAASQRVKLAAGSRR